MERGRKKWWRLHRQNESPFQTDVSEKVEAASAAVWTLMGVGCLRRDGGERRGESPSIISLCRSEGFCANSGLLTQSYAPSAKSVGGAVSNCSAQRGRNENGKLL